ARGYTIKNGTVVNDYNGRTTGGDLINTDAADPAKNDPGTVVDLVNIFFKNVADGQQINRTKGNPDTKYTNIVINGSGSVDSYIKDFNADTNPVPVGITVGSSSSNKANANAFGWTWASKAGATAGL